MERDSAPKARYKCQLKTVGELANLTEEIIMVRLTLKVEITVEQIVRLIAVLFLLMS